MEIAVDLEGVLRPGRIWRRDRQSKRSGNGDIGEKRSPESNAKQISQKSAKPRHHPFDPHAARGVQHGIRSGKIIGSAFGNDEERERNQIHPGKHAVTLAVTRNQREIKT